MRNLLFFCLFLIPAFLWAEETDVKSTVDEVTIYHSGAMIYRKAPLNLKAGVHELVMKNISSKILLNSLKFSNKEFTILNTVLVNKLTDEEFKQLGDNKFVLENQLQLLELKYKEAGFIKDVVELEKMLGFYSQKILDVRKNLRDIDRRLEEAKKLENIQLETDESAILKVIVSIEKDFNGELDFQYIAGGIGWSPAYDINVKELSDKSIELKYMAKVMSQTGENWENIKINLSSSFPLESPTELPKPSGPWTLSSYRDVQNNYNAPADIFQNQPIQQLKGIAYHQINIPSFIKLRKLQGRFAIKSNSTIFTFPILTANLPCSFFYYAYPSIDPEAYIVAQLTQWDTIGLVDGVANITVKNNNIGKSLIKFSEFTDTLTLSVGKDNSVYISRKEIANQMYNRESGALKKGKNTIAFEYNIRNNNTFPVEFRLYDQVPVSQTKTAEVEIKELSGGALNEQEGEVLWVLNLEPAKTIKKELRFEIEADPKFYVYKKSTEYHKYRAINCPSF